MVFLASILGIGLGILIAFVRDYAENSEKSEKVKMTEAKSLIIKNIMELIPAVLKK